MTLLRRWSDEDLARFSEITVAELSARPFNGIAIDCPGCRTYAGIPFRGLMMRGFARPETTVATLVGRFRCRRCERRPAVCDTAPWLVAEEQQRQS